MGSSCKFGLDLFMDFDVSFQGVYLFLGLSMFEQEVLCLFGLVLEFGGELMVLEDG